MPSSPKNAVFSSMSVGSAVRISSNWSKISTWGRVSLPAPASSQGRYPGPQSRPRSPSVPSTRPFQAGHAERIPVEHRSPFVPARGPDERRAAHGTDPLRDAGSVWPESATVLPAPEGEWRSTILLATSRSIELIRFPVTAVQDTSLEDILAREWPRTDIWHDPGLRKRIDDGGHARTPAAGAPTRWVSPACCASASRSGMNSSMLPQ